jgi:hypothetical protein
MKNSIICHVFILLTCLLLVNCSKEVKDGKQVLTVEKADEIIKKYGLESSFKKHDLAEFNAKRINTKGAVDLGSTQEITTVEDFELFIKDYLRITQSIESQIARRTNEFFQLAIQRNKKFTKIEVDSFYKALDKEFGTDLFRQREQMNNSSGVMFSTFEEIN